MDDNNISDNSNRKLKIDYVDIYNKILETLTTNVKIRFDSAFEVSFVELLNNSNFAKYRNRFPNELIQNLESVEKILIFQF